MSIKDNAMGLKRKAHQSFEVTYPNQISQSLLLGLWLLCHFLFVREFNLIIQNNLSYEFFLDKIHIVKLWPK